MKIYVLIVLLIMLAIGIISLIGKKKNNIYIRLGEIICIAFFALGVVFQIIAIIQEYGL